MVAKVFKSFQELPRAQRRVIALGNFDGLHLGHQKILEKTLEKADELGAEPLVFSFDPHPRQFFTQSDEPRLLMTREEKIKSLSRLGFENILLQKFNEEFSKINAHDFMIEILAKHLGAVAIVVGKDFHFGFRAEGSFQDLVECQRFETNVIHPVVSDQQKISSSWIRRLIETGDIEGASQSLGYTFSLAGKVIQGQGLGAEKLQVPTVNIRFEKKILPKSGVYMGILEDLSMEHFFPAVINLGHRPTVGQEKDLSLEAHLIHFKDNMYDRLVRLYFLNRIRDEKKFSNFDDLRKAILGDIKRASSCFEARSSGPDLFQGDPRNLHSNDIDLAIIEGFGILRKICY